nr:unnamed protein product [Digitaria exilis]
MAPSFLSCSYSSHSPFMHARMRMLLAEQRQMPRHVAASLEVRRATAIAHRLRTSGAPCHLEEADDQLLCYEARARAESPLCNTARGVEHHPVAVCMHRVTIDRPVHLAMEYLSAHK